MNQIYNYDSIQRFCGLSSDTKPTGCANGSIFTEMDTTNRYVYNATAEQWTLIPSGGGGTATIDSALSLQSENPVQNKIIAEVLNPISESDYESISEYTQPLYFIYETTANDENDDISMQLNQSSASLLSKQDIITDEHEELVMKDDSSEGTTSMVDMSSDYKHTKNKETENSLDGVDDVQTERDS